ncbi:glycosyltransferase [Daejeonella sp.]|uniref:glycosyltransferase n=1 Tax=Daejeonella sp. TaxID=2805397 RepID=UPI00271C145B|nr:glycosyltransferase [Daejeonella sp.]MDO8994001.1 glycosyltransferase [Daejeonella sp.]MDP2414300.1 glycosyltransferase [Daejeonella sp.]
MKENILLVGHSGDMYGASRSLIKLVRILNEEYKVYVLLPETGSLNAELSMILPADRILLNESLYIFTRNSFKIRYIGSTFARFIGNLITIRKIIRKYDIKIIHTNSGVVPAPALAAKISGRKHIWHIREWFGDFKKFWPIYSAYMTRFSDRVVCVSKTMATQFQDHKKVMTIYNGFEIPKIKTEISIPEELVQNLNQADLVLGCTSRIRLIRKGQEYLIEAIGIMTQKTGKNIQAVLIGDYVPGYEWQKETISALIKKYHLEDRIHFLGHLANPLPFYKLFDVFVLPSGEPEPFGGVIMEAMSLALPVIGSNAGGTTEQIANAQNGYLFENKNAEDLADKIGLFLNDPSSIKLFGKCSKERVEKYFSLNLHKENILILYKNIILNEK